MSKGHGMFVWYDVMTNDSKAAESFYRNVIGWDAKKLWNDRSLLHTLFGRANDGWRADADPGRSARHGRLAGLERLCPGR